ncbi:site-specific tyrosine recombinase XerD [Psychroflexus sp. CAK57W]|uniref:site-specific tyrosine recombinase XerD n=1 Tax=Psychroflexus curvus TaxID=2873595 RepID=UPI001CCB0A72|nr:site-specific tyrosine recombinase XerD [Psychroflexus curvus]MBZ9628460.1 site-specific tyrosine recombinase XerD [Psychroflexus curvus]MBZ9788093.1 site-specific tyrosine recombinase XerD [Psychroflexus curvus]
MKWEQAIQDFTYYLKIERGLADNTIQNYRLDILKLVNYLSEFDLNVSPEDITEEDIQGFIYTISKLLNERSQARLISGLKSFFDYLIFENYRKSNPLELIESPRLGRKLPDTLSTKEIDKLINAIDLSHPQGQRNKAIIETLYGCGLRVSELTGLKISHLHFEEGFIKVVGKGNKERLVPINSYTQKFIELYKDEVRIHQDPKPEFKDILFLNRRGAQLTRAMIFTIVKQLAVEAHIQKKISPHTFRHSFATHLLENGANLRVIQQMLGHESITTTEIYMHLDKTHLRSVLEQFHPRA